MIIDIYAALYIYKGYTFQLVGTQPIDPTTVVECCTQLLYALMQSLNACPSTGKGNKQMEILTVSPKSN